MTPDSRSSAIVLGPLAAALWLVASVATASNAGASTTTGEPALPEGRTLVFASDEWCPYVCFESTQPGYLVELARAVFESPSRPVEIRRMSWPRAVREAEAGRIDGVLGAAAGESPRLRYPERPAAGDPVAFAVRHDDPWRFDGVDSLVERRIGIAEGYRFGPPFDAALFAEGRPVPGVEALSTEQPTRINLQKLVGGRIDTVIDNGHVLRHESERGGFFPAVRIIATGIEQPVFVAFADSPEGEAMARHFDRTLDLRSGRQKVTGLQREYGPMDATR